MDSLAIAASGIRSAGLDLAVSAHNVANLNTPSFRPARAIQTSVKGGGSDVRMVQASQAQEVDLAREFVAQSRASLQFRGSLRAFATAAKTQSHLIDILA